MMTLAVEWLVVGALLLVLGALIKFGGWTFLIAGYHEHSSVPEAVASDMVGNTVLRIGVALVLVGAIASITTVPSSMGAIVAVVVFAAVARLLYRLNSYAPAES